MAVQPQNQGFPQISSPVVNENGIASLVWYQFFVSIWNRTGGTKGQPSPYVPSEVAITGGTIDGTAIGGTTPAAGDFSSVHVNGPIIASNFTGSSSGINTGNVSLAGDNYLTLAGQVITAHNVNLGTQVTGQISTANLPVSGLSVTITTAALTALGTQGSQTFTNGLLTAQVQAT